MNKKNYFNELLCILIITSLLTFGATVFKVTTFAISISKNIDETFNFVNLILEFNNYVKQLQSIEYIATIHRYYSIFCIIAFVIYLIYLIIKDNKAYKTPQFYNILQNVFITTFVLYITKNFFFAIKSINARLYSSSFSKKIYLMARMQELKNIYILIIVALIIYVIINILSYISLKKELNYGKNVLWYLSSLIIFSGLCFSNYQIQLSARKINPFKYYIENYTLDKDNKPILVPTVNQKKAFKKYIDLGIRNIFSNGMVFEFDKNNKDKINVSYDVEKVRENDLVITKQYDYKKKKDDVKVLENIELLDIKSLKKYLEDNEIRYIKNAGNSKILYKNDDTKGLIVYILQDIKVSQLEVQTKVKYKAMIPDNDDIKRLIYLGNVFVDGTNKVLGYDGLNNNFLATIFSDEESLNEYINKNGLMEGMKW